MAHDIVYFYLDAHLEGKNPQQMLMMVIGPGGTGKSTLLNAVTKTFTSRNSSHLLAKTAMSGVAATVINGTMLHRWGGIPTNNLTADDWMV